MRVAEQYGAHFINKNKIKIIELLILYVHEHTHTGEALGTRVQGEKKNAKAFQSDWIVCVTVNGTSYLSVYCYYYWHSSNSFWMPTHGICSCSSAHRTSNIYYKILFIFFFDNKMHLMMMFIPLSESKWTFFEIVKWKMPKLKWKIVHNYDWTWTGR